MEIIRLQDVSKSYLGDEYEIKALDHISFVVNEGEFVAIMGESGSGKSTLLNIIGCLDSASEGTVYIDSVPITELNNAGLDKVRKKYISFVFQHFALLPEFTVYENVEIPLLGKNVKRKERKQKILSILSELNIEQYKNHFPKQLSGGQQQRVAIARALVADSPIILADEPTGALDKETAVALMELLKSIHQKGKTILVVTHSDVVAEYASRCIWLDGGLFYKEVTE